MESIFLWRVCIYSSLARLLRDWVCLRRHAIPLSHQSRLVLFSGCDPTWRVVLHGACHPRPFAGGLFPAAVVQSQASSSGGGLQWFDLRCSSNHQTNAAHAFSLPVRSAFGDQAPRPTASWALPFRDPETLLQAGLLPSRHRRRPFHLRHLPPCDCRCLLHHLGLRGRLRAWCASK